MNKDWFKKQYIKKRIRLFCILKINVIFVHYVKTWVKKI